jgi:hypothetical protein
MFNRFVTLALLVLGFVSYECSAEVLLSQRVEGSEGKYVIEFPTDWKVRDGKSLGVDLVAEAPTAGEGKNFLENANIIYQALDVPTTSKAFLESGLPEVKKFEGFNLIKTEDLKIDDLDAVSIEYSYLSKGNKVMVLQYIVVKEKSGIIVTFGSDPTDYPKMKPLFDDIAKTLVIN